MSLRVAASVEEEVDLREQQRSEDGVAKRVARLAKVRQKTGAAWGRPAKYRGFKMLVCPVL
ncbi:hypothetical protein PIB30_056446 [Stylosanthes scabra]|uniref:Uncharacterized protein n=1 Tax=Stylosanthes scabra TaxID=79078 RepID=A0ABU6WJ81_9FABA|nr:hypothetical protein [Stylosanthes scabra]